MALDFEQMEKGRKRLDERIIQLPRPETWMPPVAGWLRAIREVLGITRKDAAAAAGVKPTTLLEFERGEVAGTITLASMRRAARAMGCEFVYAVVPLRGSLEAEADHMREERELAEVKRVDLTMELEGQGIARSSALEIARRVGRSRPRR